MNANDHTSQEDRELVHKLASRRHRRSDCPTLADLAAYVDGTMDAEEAERIEAHLADCPTCLDTVLDARERVDAPPMVAPKAVLDRAKAVVPVRSAWQPVVRWAAAVAASIAIGFAGLAAGSSVHRARRTQEARVTAEITFQLATADQSRAEIAEDPLRVLLLRREEVTR